MKHFVIIVAAMSISLLTVVTARSHAMLDRANPPVGSTVPIAPREVLLTFTEDLEPAFSQIEVHNSNGAIVSSGKALVDSSNHTQLRVALKPLAPGTYKVIWRVLSVDTHRAQGNFTFRVGQ